MMSSWERNSKSFVLVTLSEQVRLPQAPAVLMVLGHWCDEWHHLGQLDHCCIVFFCCCVTVLQYYCCSDVIVILKIVDWIAWFGGLLRDSQSCSDACRDVSCCSMLQRSMLQRWLHQRIFFVVSCFILVGPPTYLILLRCPCLCVVCFCGMRNSGL